MEKSVGNKSKNSKKKFVIVFLIVIAITGIVIFCKRDSFKEKYILKQIEAQYGRDSIIGQMLIKEENGESIAYIYMASDVVMQAKIDWKGKIISDNYMYYYYADEINSDMLSLLGEYSDKCVVISNLEKIESEDAISFDSVNTYEKYKNVCGNKISLKVFIKEVDEDLSDEIVDLFAKKSVDVTVRVVNDNMFDTLKNSNLVYSYNAEQVLYDIGYDWDEIKNFAYDERQTEILDAVFDRK